MEDNKLNDIFRDRFDKDALTKEGWNTPDNEVWNNIEKTLPKPKKESNKSSLIPFILSLVLLGFMFLGYKYLQKAEEVQNLEYLLKECSDSKVETLGNVNYQNHTSAANHQNINGNSQPNSSLGKQSADITSQIYVTPRSQYNTVNQSNKINNKNGTWSGDVILPSSDVYHKPALGALDQSDIKQNMMANLEDSRPEINITPLQNLINNSFATNYDHFDTNGLSANMATINPYVKKSGPLMVGVGTGYNHWIDQKNGTIKSPLSELLLNESTAPSIHFQLNIKKFISRSLAVNFGLSTYSRNQRSTFRLSLPYSTSNEVLHGNEMHNYFEHSLPTSLGSINTNLTLARSISSNVTNNENVDIDFSLSNKIRAINVPITLIYYPMNNRQGLYFETGINTEFIYQQKLANVTTNSFHSQVDDREMKVAFDRKQIEQVNFSIPLGLGYTKNLGSDISIDFFANYGFGLNNMHMHEGFTHKIDRISTQISVFKSL